MTDSVAGLRGQCLCGAVEFEADHPLKLVGQGSIGPTGAVAVDAPGTWALRFSKDPTRGRKPA